VFWPLWLNSEVSGVPEDSQVPISGVWVSSSHFLKVGLRYLVTNAISYDMLIGWEALFLAGFTIDNWFKHAYYQID